MRMKGKEKYKQPWEVQASICLYHMQEHFILQRQTDPPNRNKMHFVKGCLQTACHYLNVYELGN